MEPNIAYNIVERKAVSKTLSAVAILLIIFLSFDLGCTHANFRTEVSLGSARRDLYRERNFSHLPTGRRLHAILGVSVDDGRDVLGCERVAGRAERQAVLEGPADLRVLQAERRGELGLVEVPGVVPARPENVDGRGAERVGKWVQCARGLRHRRDEKRKTLPLVPPSTSLTQQSRTAT